ncbi:MAG TPA: adenine phosphoribosyltransferase [Acidimicrobiales bacterium]|nr:adenine phosphoribosyltransferase [Acidimicrobiales bacterium]
MAHWLDAHLRDIPDFPEPGVVFKDITPLLGDAAAFRRAVDELAAPHEGVGITHVVGVEARGFLFAAPVAYRLGAGCVPFRKPGKLPYETVEHTYELEYGTDTLTAHVDAVAPGARVLVVDDVLATGGTARAACTLLEDLGGEIVECAFLLELAFLHGRDALAGERVRALLTVS